MTRTAGVPSLRRVLTVTPVLIVSLFVLLLAAQAFSETRRFSDIIALARIADEDNGLSSDLLTKTVEGLQPVIAEKICRSDIIKAGMRLVLADIDAHAGDASPEADAMRLGFAETYMRHALSCLPANGDVWLRLAMVRSLRNASAMESAVLTNFSQLYGPADANLIRGRFVIWQQFTKGALPQAEAAREADTAIVCGRQGEILRWSLRHVCSQELQTGMQSAKPRP